jgi:hypothetical protein
VTETQKFYTRLQILLLELVNEGVNVAAKIAGSENSTSSNITGRSEPSLERSRRCLVRQPRLEKLTPQATSDIPSKNKSTE